MSPPFEAHFPRNDHGLLHTGGRVPILMASIIRSSSVMLRTLPCNCWRDWLKEDQLYIYSLMFTLIPAGAPRTLFSPLIINQGKKEQ
jgi:hypothetical protein